MIGRRRFLFEDIKTGAGDVAAIEGRDQIGVDHVLMGGPPIPWTEEALRALLDRFAAGGLRVVNLMIGGYPKTLYGRQGRDEEPSCAWFGHDHLVRGRRYFLRSADRS